MKTNRNTRSKLLFSISLLVCILLGCVERISIKDEADSESILVVEATVTDEFKFHEILLSRTFELETDGPFPETEATVKLITSTGSTINFIEQESGSYISEIEFSALQNIDYHIEIITNDGNEYASENEVLAPNSIINDVIAQRGFNENGDEGISILVDAINTDGEATYYRYQYDETYKIIAPLYSPLELEVLNNDFAYPDGFLDQFSSLQEAIDFFFDLKSRDEQEQICYNTVKSNTIIISSTEELVETDTDIFKVRFLNRNNPIIMHRYSILVKQYIQSKGAHNFYKTLMEFSSSESLFSQVQPGFFEGNIVSLPNENEKVIGFFEVASYSEKRIYFNFDDLFSGEMKPPYFVSCDETYFPVFLKEDFAHNIIASPIIEALTSGTPQIYYESTEDMSFSPFAVTPFELVLKQCGDCTVYGNNVAPDFWIE